MTASLNPHLYFALAPAGPSGRRTSPAGSLRLPWVPYTLRCEPPLRLASTVRAIADRPPPSSDPAAGHLSPRLPARMPHRGRPCPPATCASPPRASPPWARPTPRHRTARNPPAPARPARTPPRLPSLRLALPRRLAPATVADAGPRAGPLHRWPQRPIGWAGAHAR